MLGNVLYLIYTTAINSKKKKNKFKTTSQWKTLTREEDNLKNKQNRYTLNRMKILLLKLI